MGQLRDWWPSEEALVKRSSQILPTRTHAHTSPPLQLSEAAAALNEEKCLSPQVASSFSFLPSPSPQPIARAPIKLINSQDHKQELLRNLLNLRPSVVDVPQRAPSPSQSLLSQDDNFLNPASPGSFGHLVNQVHGKTLPSSSASLNDDVSLSLFRRSIPSTHTQTTMTSAHEVHPHTFDESMTVERASRGGSHEVHHHSFNNKESSASKKVLHHPFTSKESLTSEKEKVGTSEKEKAHRLHGVLHNSINNGVEKSSHEVLQNPINKQSLTSDKTRSLHEVHQEKTRSLHEVHQNPISKDSLSRREIHIFSERQRRKGMTHLYTTLLSLLPDAKPKTDRCKVLTDAMDYIHLLREQVEALGCQKEELLSSFGEHQGEYHNTDYTSGADGEAANSSSITGMSDEAKEEILSSADVAVRFCGREAFITLNSSKSKGVWSGILQILHDQDMEILNVTLSSGNEMDHHCIHARMQTTSTIGSQQVEKMLQDLILSHAVVD